MSSISAQRQEHAPSLAVASVESRSYFPGMGCQCAARSEGECGCDADWTPSEVHDLRARLKEARESLAFRRDLYRFQRKLMYEIGEERDKLQHWKRGAMAVFDEWETVWVAAGSPGIIGQSKASAVRQFIKEKIDANRSVTL